MNTLNIKLSRLSFLLACVFFVGCAGQDAQVLQQEKSALESELSSANTEIRRLKQAESSLRDKIGELQHTTGVLTTEKTSRVTESSSLRGQVRRFVQGNIDDLKEFMVKGELLDYIGSALVARAKQDSGPVFLIDFANPIPSAGVLTGLGGHFIKSDSLVVKVLHPVGGQHVVIWESKTIRVKGTGKQQIQFPVSVGVEKGDVMGYYFAKNPNVSFDTSTGETLFQNSDVALGGTVSKTFLSGVSERRAYSLGVYGLLSAN